MEFRAVDEHGKPYSHPSRWRVLNGEEIKLHFALQTPVAEWLDKNLYSPPRPLKNYSGRRGIRIVSWCELRELISWQPVAACPIADRRGDPML